MKNSETNQDILAAKLLDILAHVFFKFWPHFGREKISEFLGQNSELVNQLLPAEYSTFSSEFI